MTDRHFQHTSGSVAIARDPEDVTYFQDRFDYTEVKVVPLDAIAIEAEDLPEVVEAKDGCLRVGSQHFSRSRAANRDLALWKKALRDLALELYDREHPPVDEAQVKALAFQLQGVSGYDLATEEGRRHAAEDMAHAGVRMEVKS